MLFSNNDINAFLKQIIVWKKCINLPIVHFNQHFDLHTISRNFAFVKSFLKSILDDQNFSRAVFFSQKFWLLPKSLKIICAQRDEKINTSDGAQYRFRLQ